MDFDETRAKKSEKEVKNEEQSERERWEREEFHNDSLFDTSF